MATIPASTFPIESPRRSGLAAGERLRHRERLDPASGDPTVAISNSGFEALLRATQAMARAAHSGYGGAASADQMFEAPVDGDRQPGSTRAGLDTQARGGSASSPGIDRLDRTSVQARRHDAASESPRMGHRPSSEPAGGPGSAARSVPSGPDARSDARAFDVADAAARSAHRPVDSQRDASRPGGRGDSLPPAGQSAAPATDAARSSASPNGETATVRAAQGAVKPAGATPAQQVGQILGGGRVAGVEALRATAPSTGGGAGPRGGHGDGQADAARTSRSGASPGETKGRGEFGGASDVERTPFDKLVRSIRLNRSARQSSARIQLDPPELGRLDVDVRISGDRIRIEVRTQSAQARKLVQDQAGRLTTALQQQGISVESLEVTVDGQGGEPTGSLTDGETGNAADRGRSASAAGATGRPAGAAMAEIGTTDVGNNEGHELRVVSETRLDIRI